MLTTVLLGPVVAAVSIMVTPFASGWVLIAMAIDAGMGIGTVWTNPGVGPRTGARLDKAAPFPC